MSPGRSLALRACAVWLLMMAAETLHAIARAAWIVPAVGERQARPIGFAAGSLIVLLIAWALAPWLRAGTRAERIAVGLAWAALLLLFEIGLGLARGLSWAAIQAEFVPSRGGWMAFALLVMAAAPSIAAGIRARSR